MIKYVSETATEYSKRDVLELMVKLDKYFVPPLSSRVNLEDYANKLDQYASMVLAFSESGKLVGMIAFYNNNQSDKIAYITYLGVLPAFQGNGIANYLLKDCIWKCKDKGMNFILVETWENNDNVIHLYKKKGFKLVNKVADRININSIKLELKL
jgi:ribosomal protein S18 acetylase RimI-like enzyme